ncbi:hypothetical protein COV18_00280 [Candidatus Woesearchaeota archaeon CG10_big_fil_rev_8_21_14_0_10_37_12]|nr:MAG: hypothetical protein COV18_00280 [Candidatus Woesearchaeota archaeon CG10_big_fil_rev_8_21_14_0_10_37_12]
MLDQTGKKILGLYFENTRASLTTISKKLKIPKSTVNYHIKKLEKEKIITRNIALFNYPNLGFCAGYSLLLKVADCSDDDLNSIFHMNDSVVNAFRITGNFDIASTVFVRTVANIQDILDIVKKQLKGRLRDSSVSRINRLIFHPLKKELYTSMNPVVLNFEEIQQIKMKNEDKQILRIIARDGNVSLVEIANQLKIPAQRVAYKFRQLIHEKIILHFRPILDLKYKAAIFHLKLISSSKLLKTLEVFANQDKNVNVHAFMDGPFQATIQILYQDYSEVVHFNDKLKKLLGDDLKSLEWCIAGKEILREVLPY